MIHGKGLPAPCGRIWAACYMDAETECFELRTEFEHYPGSICTLYHKEYAIGMALTDFLYVDMTVFPVHLEKIKTHLKQIEAGKHVTEQFMQLFYMAMDWLKQSAIFAPLAASIQRLHLRFEKGKALGITEIEEQMAYYTALQPKLLYLANHLFEIETQENMLSRYYDQIKHLQEEISPETENYLPLTYSKISICVVSKGAAGFFDYDNFLDTCFSTNPADAYHNDIQDFIAETINTAKAEDFTQFLLSAYLRQNVRFRICKYCGRYFGITGNPKTEFCDRLIDGSQKTCKEAGSLRLYEKKRLENPILRAYKRSYRAHNARIRYGIMTREEFNTWSQEARRQRDLCLAGDLPIEEFIAWLESDRQK